MKRSQHPSALPALLAAAAAFLVACSPEKALSPPPHYLPPSTNPVEELRYAYITGDHDRLASLLSPDGEGVDFLFILNEPDPGTGERHWGRAEETRIHQRMLDPENPPPGESPVPQEYWLQAVSISLTPIRDFVERTGLGLPPKWRVWEGLYHANITFDLQGPIDYAVDGKANFLVIEDTTLPDGSQGKFLIYRWEDLGAFKPSASRLAEVRANSWTRIKSMYRK